MGTPIDRVGGGGFGATERGGGFGATGRGGVGGNLMTDKGGGRAEMVLSGAEGAERDTD